MLLNPYFQGTTNRIGAPFWLALVFQMFQQQGMLVHYLPRLNEGPRVGPIIVVVPLKARAAFSSMKVVNFTYFALLVGWSLFD